MERTSAPRFTLLSALFVVLLVLLAGSAASAQPASPRPGHDAHHDATPAPVGPPTMMPGMGAGTPAMGGMMQMQEFDLMFIDMMTMHHQGAIAMAEVALERGEHPELVTLAEDIIAAQEAEIAQLLAWRDAWYPDAPALAIDEMMAGMGQMMGGMPGMGNVGGMMGMIEMMGMMDPTLAAESLRAAPEPFDLAFINAMIPHHQSALMMAEMAIQNATHPELAALAQAMTDAQTAEIAQLRAWRVEWYGIPATPAS